MESLPDLLEQVEPAPDSLIHIYEKLPDETLAAEEARLRQQFLDTGSKIVAISQVRGAE